MYLESSGSPAGDSHGHFDQTHDVVRLSDTPCRAQVDTASGAWALEATHAGKVRLEFDGVPVAALSSLLGANLLREGGCPFERAEQILTALCVRSCLSPSADVRDELEYALACWIPMYFDP